MQTVQFEQLQAFEQQHSGTILAGALAALTRQPTIRQHLRPVPCQLFPALEVVFDNVDQARGVTQWSSENSRRSNLRAALLQDWSQKSSTLQGEDQGKKVRKVAKTTLCQKYGFCICSGEGLNIYKLRNRLLQLLKRQVPRHSKERKKLLTEGHMCVHLIAPQQEEASSGWAALGDALLQDSETSRSQSGDREAWWHIACHFLKPYRPTIQSLDFIEARPAGQVLLAQTGKFLTDVEACASLSLSATWTVELYEMICSNSTVAMVRPKEALFVRRVGDETLWPPPQTTARKRRTISRAPLKAALATAESALPLPPVSASGALPEEDAYMEGRSQPPSEQDEADFSSGDEGSEVDDLRVRLLDETLAPLDEALQQEGGQPAPVTGLPEELALDTSLGLGEASMLEELQRHLLNFAADQTNQPNQLQQEPAPLPVMPEPVPVPPQPPAAAAGKEPPVQPPQRRERAEIFLLVAGGKLTYYVKGEFFTASCDCAGHDKCTLTRTAKAGRKASQGRPLGFLMAWLAMGAACRHKAEHWNKANWPNQEQRAAARESLKRQPGGEALLAMERPLGPDEAEEPEGLP